MLKWQPRESPEPFVVCFAPPAFVLPSLFSIRLSPCGAPPCQTYLAYVQTAVSQTQIPLSPRETRSKTDNQQVHRIALCSRLVGFGSWFGQPQRCGRLETALRPFPVGGGSDPAGSGSGGSDGRRRRRPDVNVPLWRQSWAGGLSGSRQTRQNAADTLTGQR